MKNLEWPLPPIHKERIPPSIPDKFAMFGVEYKVENGNPYLDIPSSRLDKKSIRESINKSFNTFMKLVQSFDCAHLDEIRDLHIAMNEQLNTAKVFEGENSVVQARNGFLELKVKILEEIEQAFLN